MLYDLSRSKYREPTYRVIHTIIERKSFKSLVNIRDMNRIRFCVLFDDYFAVNVREFRWTISRENRKTPHVDISAGPRTILSDIITNAGTGNDHPVCVRERRKSEIIRHGRRLNNNALRPEDV